MNEAMKRMFVALGVSALGVIIISIPLFFVGQGVGDWYEQYGREYRNSIILKGGIAKTHIDGGRIVVHGQGFDGIIFTPEKSTKSGTRAAWVPSDADIQKAEKALQKFFSSRKLEAVLPDYVRIYTGIMEKNRSILEVQLNLWKSHETWKDEDYVKKRSPDGRSEGTVILIVKYDLKNETCFDYRELDIGY